VAAEIDERTMVTFAGNRADCTQHGRFRQDTEESKSDDGCSLQTCIRKLGVAGLDQFVEVGDALMHLSADAAEEPITNRKARERSV